MTSIAREDYLKAMWKLGSSNIGTLELANHLEVTPASATNMILKLSENGLVMHKPYKGASLTDTGLKQALSVVRRHRLLETFLSKTLGLSNEDLHVEAERLEHALSKNLENSIAEYLDNPVRDPHGHPIPGPNGEILTNDDIVLSDCPINSTTLIRQVPDEDLEILLWLKNNGIILGQKMYIKSKNNFDDSLVVEINDSLIEISSIISKLVYVTRE
ncbi:MAG: metal-dependent transcriptional regulator [Candidatus Thalassarchaeaceae archaeon]|nr:metal-dependent transcriptional regulator [Candidatus Thalassarchaeaceae archaeon]